MIEGRVIDKKTGEPLEALVDYHAYRDNPNLADAAGFDRARQQHYNKKTTPDGSYRLIGLPGHGLVAAIYTGGAKQYLKGTGVPGGDLPGSILPIVPGGMMWEFNVLSEVNLPQKGTTHHIDLALETGVTRTVRVVDPEGRALAGAGSNSKLTSNSLSPPQQAAEFLVESLRPDEVRQLLAFHEERKLAGHVEIHASDTRDRRAKTSAMGNRARPPGGRRGRCTNGSRHRPIRPGSETGHNGFPGSLSHRRACAGQGGRMCGSHRIAGYLSGTVAKGLVLKPGEVRDLGDVREKQ